MNNWRNILIGFTILETLLLAAFFYDSGKFSGANDREAQGYAAHYARTSEESINRLCTAGTGYAKCVREIVQATHEDQRGEANLNWQRQSARWAWWSLVIALAQGLVGAAGLWGLFKSLGQTDKALTEATNANAVATRNASFELRPWLSIKLEITMFVMTESNIKFGYSVSFENTGRTIARNVTARAKAVYAIYEQGPDAIKSQMDKLSLEREFSENTLVPNDIIDAPGQVYQSVAHLDWDSSDSTLLVVLAVARFTSEIDGIERYIEQSFTIGRRSGDLFEQRLIEKNMVGKGPSDLVVKRYLSGRAT